jgi:hypothetical protein
MMGFPKLLKTLNAQENALLGEQALDFDMAFARAFMGQDVVTALSSGAAANDAELPDGGMVSGAAWGPVFLTAQVTTGKTTISGGIGTSTTTTTTTTVPSWIKTLTNAGIAKDMAAAAADGTLTFSELKTLFLDVYSTLSSSKTAFTSAQFSDLRTVAANLSNGLSTSSYVTSITQALVNGTPFNATWTGGTTSTVALGNMSAGMSALAFGELVGKWYLGSDLPNARVSMSGTSFTVSYSNAPSSIPLYSANGPSMNDINQGYLGDCYLLSCLSEMADQDPNRIKSMINVNGDGTYGVRFFVNGSAQWVTVNSALANGGTIFDRSGTSLWSQLIEKAYAQFQGEYSTTGNSSARYGNSWSSIGNGGNPANALAALTGASQITSFWNYNGSWATGTQNASLAWTSSRGGLSGSTVLSSIRSALDAGNDVILCSYTNARDSSGKTTLVASHAMSIYGYNSVTGNLQVRNPWGSAAGQTWATTFEVSLATLLAAGDVIQIDNVGKSSTTVAGSGTTTTVASRTVAGEAGSLDIPLAEILQSMASMGSASGSLDTVFAPAAGSSTPTLVAALA